MPFQGPTRRLRGAVERMMASLACAAFARPWWTLGLCALLTLGLAFPLSELELDADMTALLPSSARSVKDLDGLAERFGGLGQLVIVGEDAEPEALKRFASDVSERLRDVEGVRYVDHERPLAFFQDRALLYADTGDLIELERRVVERIRWERKDRNPLLVKFEETEPPSLDFSELKRKLEGAGELTGGVGEKEGFFLFPEARRVLIFVKPDFLAADLHRSRDFIARVESLLADVDLGRYGAGMRVGMTGRYKKRPELQAHMSASLQRSSLLALGLMLLVLALHFRRAAAVALVIFPLGISLVWTMGLAALVFGKLNILTGLVTAILLGLGIDHGIHLLGRYESERARGDARAALEMAFARTGRAVVVAGLTTLAAFLAISLSDFRAFHEFGLVAACGVTLAVLAFTTLLPAFLGLAESLGWRPHAEVRADESSSDRAPARSRSVLLGVVLALLVLPVFFVAGLRFDYDFGSMEVADLPAYRLDREVNALLGVSETPLVVWCDDEPQEREVTERLRQRQREAGEGSTIKWVISASRLVPEDQADKLEILGDLRRSLARVDRDELDEETRQDLERLDRMSRAEAFGRVDLPIGLRRQFGMDRDAGQGGAVLVYPAVSTRDGQAVRRFAREVSGLRLADGRRVAVAGEAMILAELLDVLLEEAPPLLLLTLVLVFLSLWLLLGCLRDAVLSLFPAVITLVAVCGLLPLAGVQVTYLSIIFFLVLVGISVDGGVHLVSRLRDEPGNASAFADSGRAVSGAVLTSGLAFGSLFIADHQGLISVAQLMILGLMANLLASLVMLPGILGLRAFKVAR